MVRYYNRTRGPLAVTLASGKSVAVAPKSWLEIAPEEDGSASLMTHLSKGHLVRAAVQPVLDAPVAVVVPEISMPLPPVVAVQPEKIEKTDEPVAVVEAAVEEVPTEADISENTGVVTKPFRYRKNR